MITAPVTNEQLDHWKQLWKENISSIKPNRITGTELNDYFQDKYSPRLFEDKDFKEVVKHNLIQRYGDKTVVSPRITCYLIDADIYVGIDVNTGFFHVESENIEKCIPIYNDLFVKRGLDKDDIQNYVLVGQYIELLES